MQPGKGNRKTYGWLSEFARSLPIPLSPNRFHVNPVVFHEGVGFMHVRHHASHAGSSHANSAHTNSWANSSANSWIRLKWQVGLRSLVQASALVLLPSY